MQPDRHLRPHGPDRPPPLARRPSPAALRRRVLLWRARPVLLVLALAAGTSGVLDALRPDPGPTVDVVVAARSLASGARLTAVDLAVREVPADVAPDDAATRVADVLDRVVAVDLTPGSPLVPGVVVPADARGPAGTVVATVRLADEAAAALLGPGMHVDVLAATPDDTTGRLVATRALVLPGAPAPAGAGTGLAGIGTGAGDPTAAAPVLLAVTPDEARALAGATATALLSAVVVP